MKRFSFVTGTVPETGGEGVEFESGLTAWRERVADRWTTIHVTSRQDIENQYGGQPGYKFTWADK
jgi:hypothetical protein